MIMIGMFHSSYKKPTKGIKVLLLTNSIIDRAHTGPGYSLEPNSNQTRSVTCNLKNVLVNYFAPDTKNCLPGPMAP